MTIPDLVFLASVAIVLVLFGRVLFFRRGGRYLFGFLTAYFLTLVLVGLLSPRRYYVQGQRRCFDDWCVTVIGARPADTGRAWVAEVELSSTARRVRQSARDAGVEIEDEQGRRYEPTAAGRSLSDELGPGESFRVLLQFQLPDGARPAGLVVHHGDFPGVVVIGADQSLFHAPALMQFAH